MIKDNVLDLKKPKTFPDDPITKILQNGAKKLLTQALEALDRKFFITICLY